MQNLNKLSEEEISNCQKQIAETMNSYDIKTNEIVKNNNSDTFIHIIAILKNGENFLDTSIYYTVMNGRLITISFRYYNQSVEMNKEAENEIIKNIQFYEVARPNYRNINEVTSLAMGVSFILFFIIMIIVLFIRRKDKKLINKNIKDIKIKQNSKFGGLILFFWSLCFFQILICVIDIDSASKIEKIDFYANAVTIQSTIYALIMMYQIYITVKRKQNTPKKIIKSNILMTITGTTTTLIRIIYAIIVPLDVYTKQYFEQEISVIMFSIIYPLIWILYFTFSKRVQIYYYLPNKGYKEILKETKIYQWIKYRKE